LVEDSEGGVSILGELVEVPDNRWLEIVSSDPSGIVQGPVQLDDGRWVTASFGTLEFLSEHGQEITKYGGFLAYIRSIDLLAPE
jgi:hypothetical protein